MPWSRFLLFIGLLLALIGWGAVLLARTEDPAPLGIGVVYLVLPYFFITGYVALDDRLFGQSGR